MNEWVFLLVVNEVFFWAYETIRDKIFLPTWQKSSHFRTTWHKLSNHIKNISDLSLQQCTKLGKSTKVHVEVCAIRRGPQACWRSWQILFLYFFQQNGQNFLRIILYPLCPRYLRENRRRSDEKDWERARSRQSVRWGTLQWERWTQQRIRPRSFPRKSKEIFRPVDSRGIQREAWVRWNLSWLMHWSLTVVLFWRQAFEADSGFGFCPYKVHLKMQCFSLIMSIYSYQYSKCFFHTLQLKTVFESCKGIYDRGDDCLNRTYVRRTR